MKVMKKSISLALILLGYTVAIPAVQAEGYEYYSNQGALVYGSNFGGQKKIIAKFTGINRRDLYPVENISGEQERYIIEDEVTTIKEEYHWITDGHVILWRGKIVSNPPGTPMVDVASFKALGRFAVDKYSLYFDGQRTESNNGASKVDLATLKAIEDNSSTLVDRHNLYLLGRRQASSDDFSVLQSKLWGDIERFRPRNEGATSRDLLIRHRQDVFLNGQRIADVDADTFHIIRWIPNSLLVYRDKHGEHRYAYGNPAGKMATTDDANSFEIGEKTVRWRRQLARDDAWPTQLSWDVIWGAWQDIPNVDPEQFHLITDRIAQYQDRLYIIKLSPVGEDQLNVITLDTPDLVVDHVFNGGKKHIYIIKDRAWVQDVHVIATHGPLTMAESFAWDDRYVYAWRGQRPSRTESPCPEQTVEQDDGIVIKTEASECHRTP